MHRGSDVEPTTAKERIEEALREIAVLFIALAPLDAALGAHSSEVFAVGLIFVGIGVILFAATLFMESKP